MNYKAIFHVHIGKCITHYFLIGENVTSIYKQIRRDIELGVYGYGGYMYGCVICNRTGFCYDNFSYKI